MPHSKMFHQLVAVSASAVLILVSFPRFVQTAQADEMPTAELSETPAEPSSMLGSEQALLDLTNADRATNGVADLQFDPELLSIARDRAASQLGDQALSHYDANGQLIFVEMLQSAQIGFGLAGENLARSNTNVTDTAGQIEVALMNSPLHRQNILDQGFDRIAIGSATDAQGQITYAEIFRRAG